jgi:hypothetical protein
MNIIQIWCGENLPEPISGATVITLPECDNPWFASEQNRFELATKIPDMVYADFDITLKDGFESFIRSVSGDGKPYFSYYNDKPTAGLFFVNGQCEFFKQLFVESEKRKLQPVYGWERKLLRDKKTGIIFDELYVHRFDTLRTKIKIRNK